MYPASLAGRAAVCPGEALCSQAQMAMRQAGEVASHRWDVAAPDLHPWRLASPVLSQPARVLGGAAQAGVLRRQAPARGRLSTSVEAGHCQCSERLQGEDHWCGLSQPPPTGAWHLDTRAPRESGAWKAFHAPADVLRGVLKASTGLQCAAVVSRLQPKKHVSPGDSRKKVATTQRTKKAARSSCPARVDESSWAPLLT